MTIKLGREFWKTINELCRAKVVIDAPQRDSALSPGAPRVGATDLYVWWAIETEFRSSRPSGGGIPWNLPFVAEGDVLAFATEMSSLPQQQVQVPPEYLNGLGQGALAPARYFTFNVRVPRLQGLDPALRDPPLDIEKLKVTLALVFGSKSLLRIQMGFPRGQFEHEQPLPATEGTAPASVVTPAWQTLQPAAAVGRKDARVVVGVIDDGAAFAHRSLRGKPINTTRVAILWSQSPERFGLSKEYWRLPVLSTQYGSGSTTGWYGAMMRAEQMTDAMKHATRNGEVDEVACYTSLFEPARRHRAIETRFRHGAAVLTTFAGDVSASNAITSGHERPRIGLNAAVDDACSSAPIILVDLPYEQVTISSGRWMPIAALDGVRFILAEARALYQTPDRQLVPVVVNISSGSTAGSHDGNSMFESALAELLDADPNFAVTIAAGNSRLSRIHSAVDIPPGGSASVTFRVPPAKKFETYVEFWPEWLTPSSDQSTPDASSLSFSVVAPDGRKTGPLAAGGNGEVFVDAKNRIVAGMNYADNVVQACQRPMALLVIAATAPHAQFNHAPYGNWTVRCENNSKHPICLRSWIERDEIVFGVARPQSAHFTDPEAGGATYSDWDEDAKSLVTRYNTISNLASARQAFAVAAGTGGRERGFVSPYSGGGSDSGVGRPKLISRADRSPAQPGVPVFGAYRGARQHMNGTSIAAPQAARWIANYMANGHDRYDVEILAQCSVPREHPHLVDAVTGEKRVAAGEGKWFVDPNDPSMELCIGKPR